MQSMKGRYRYGNEQNTYRRTGPYRLFGRRNAGKSSVLNAVIGQELAVVSDVKGTTTDPVYKSMELLPLGPVTVIDTPGIDDEGELGTLRVRKSYQVLNKTDVAVIVVDSQAGFGEQEEKLLNRMQEKQIPVCWYLIRWIRKCSLSGEDKRYSGSRSQRPHKGRYHRIKRNYCKSCKNRSSFKTTGI